jgi:hypothetical protein
MNEQKGMSLLQWFLNYLTADSFKDAKKALEKAREEKEKEWKDIYKVKYHYDINYMHKFEAMNNFHNLKFYIKEYNKFCEEKEELECEKE